ncbi:hypothetical protein ACLMJK_000142 [Lecanora helva]
MDPNQGNQAGGEQKEDYADKGLDAIEKKFGGGKVDPEKQRGMNEKITDGARGMFEKATGKHVPEKFSN